MNDIARVNKGVKLDSLPTDGYDSNRRQTPEHDFENLWNEAKAGHHSSSFSNDQGIVGALRTVDQAMQQYETTAALSSLVSKNDLLGVHQMNMKLEHDSHVAKMMFTTATSVAGSVKSTLTQLLKNQ